MKKIKNAIKCLPILFSGIYEAFRKLNSFDQPSNQSIDRGREFRRKNDQVMIDHYRSSVASGRSDYYFK